MTAFSESNKNRWEFCIDHYGDAVSVFFKQHFSEEHRQCLFIGGIGFDPRSNIIVNKLCDYIDKRIRIILIREKRSSSDAELAKREKKNIAEAEKLSARTKVLEIDIFSKDDGAVVGGRKISESIKRVDITEYTDIVIDLSTLSIGVSFPLVKYIYQQANDAKKPVNVHLMFISNNELDSCIYKSSTPAASSTNVKGFEIPNLLGKGEKAKLWLPLVPTDKNEILEKIYDITKPHDIFPIFPFPSKEPRKGDELATAIHYMEKLESIAKVEPQDFIYTDEERPLDIYRTIMRINEDRESVFETFGGSTLILSPLSNRMPSIGMLMAALEGGFPVVHVEILNYHVEDWGKVDEIQKHMEKDWEKGEMPKDLEIAHVWLYGEAYYNDSKKFASLNKPVDHE